MFRSNRFISACSKALLAKARGLACKYQLQREIKKLRLAVENTPSVYNLRRLARTYRAANRLKDAIGTYRQALNGFFRGDESLTLELAEIYFENSDFSEAVALLQQLLTSNNPDVMARAHLLFARCLERQSDKKALREYASLHCYYPGLEASVRYAALLHKLGDTQQARDVSKVVMFKFAHLPHTDRAKEGAWLQWLSEHTQQAATPEVS